MSPVPSTVQSSPWVCLHLLGLLLLLSHSSSTVTSRKDPDPGNLLAPPNTIQGDHVDDHDHVETMSLPQSSRNSNQNSPGDTVASLTPPKQAMEGIALSNTSTKQQPAAPDPPPTEQVHVTTKGKIDSTSNETSKTLTTSTPTTTTKPTTKPTPTTTTKPTAPTTTTKPTTTPTTTTKPTTTPTPTPTPTPTTTPTTTLTTQTASTMSSPPTNVTTFAPAPSATKPVTLSSPPQTTAAQPQTTKTTSAANSTPSPPMTPPATSSTTSTTSPTPTAKTSKSTTSAATPGPKATTGSVAMPQPNSSSTRTPQIQKTSPPTGPATVTPTSHRDEGMRQGNGVVDVAGSALTRKLVDTASLLAVLLFGLLFFLVTVAVFVTQAYESYRRKDYTQVDYLINGMYTDSGV
ncbi:uncharacterized protein C11orf24-like [Cheilinus undulatus]|uniref:uncharacterized protein C11orf24-like n=1 Tax=Cheilinus undulatus TaxID=241271 RepID=UPI001BD2D10E|nr:uncharacterized protein C11orf24-like [Cheilinus undulatus]XP_041650961.1 uncharacterized protein C11orf24-like [Cheilinus undulatus]